MEDLKNPSVDRVPLSYVESSVKHLDPFQTMIPHYNNRLNGNHFRSGAKDITLNQYFRYYLECPVLFATIERSVDITKGSSMNLIQPTVPSADVDYGELSVQPEFVESLIRDLWIFNGCAFVVHRYQDVGEPNTEGFIEARRSSTGTPMVYSLTHIPFHTIRVSRNLDGFYVSDFWPNPASRDILFYPSDSEQPTFMIYYTVNKVDGIYPYPTFVSSQTDVESFIGSVKNTFSSVKQGFNSTILINLFKQRPAENIEDKELNGFKEFFSGVWNAGKVLFNYLGHLGSDKAGHSFEPVIAPDDTERIQRIIKTASENIFFSLRQFPQLVGTSWSTALSSQEYKLPFQVFKTFSADPVRQRINSILKDYLEVEFKDEYNFLMEV